jgi:hypothetical protein
VNAGNDTSRPPIQSIVERDVQARGDVGPEAETHGFSDERLAGGVVH